jgi:hypothetical protein
MYFTPKLQQVNQDLRPEKSPRILFWESVDQILCFRTCVRLQLSTGRPLLN